MSTYPYFSCSSDGFRASAHSRGLREPRTSTIITFGDGMHVHLNGDREVTMVEVSDRRPFGEPFDAEAADRALNTARFHVSAMDPDRLEALLPPKRIHGLHITRFENESTAVVWPEVTTKRVGDEYECGVGRVTRNVVGEILRLDVMEISRWGNPFDDVAAGRALEQARMDRGGLVPTSSDGRSAST